MFQDAKFDSIGNIDLSAINTLVNMFKDCTFKSIGTITTSSACTSLQNFFIGATCYNELDMEGKITDMTGVVNASSMFEGCNIRKLLNLDVATQTPANFQATFIFMNAQIPEGLWNVKLKGANGAYFSAVNGNNRTMIGSMIDVILYGPMNPVANDIERYIPFFTVNPAFPVKPASVLMVVRTPTRVGPNIFDNLTDFRHRTDIINAFEHGALESESVDKVLVSLAAMVSNPAYTNTIAQTVQIAGYNAAPKAAGTAAVATLTGAGWTVVHN